MKNKLEYYENIIIGGGWSAIEAANVIAGTGKQTLLMTINLDTVGWINIPEEKVIPASKKLLIEKKAVLPKIIKREGTTNNKWDYCSETKSTLDSISSLLLRQDTATSIIKTKNTYIVRCSSGQKYSCSKLIVCVGTFLNSFIDINGYELDMAGRDNEISSGMLGDELKKLGVGLIKTKTELPAVYVNKKSELILNNNKDENKVADNYTIFYCVLKKGQLKESFEHIKLKNLFFAGRCCGIKSTWKSAISGMVAGLSVVGSNKEAKIVSNNIL